MLFLLDHPSVERLVRRVSSGYETLVKVVDVDGGREISWGSSATERLQERIADVQKAVSDGVRAVSSSLKHMVTVDGWHIDEVEASFGVSLVAEAGAVLTKVSGEATFEVNVVFRRNDAE